MSGSPKLELLEYGERLRGKKRDSKSLNYLEERRRNACRKAARALVLGTVSGCVSHRATTVGGRAKSGRGSAAREAASLPWSRARAVAHKALANLSQPSLRRVMAQRLKGESVTMTHLHRRRSGRVERYARLLHVGIGRGAAEVVVH